MYDKKSIRAIVCEKPDWNEIAKDCVAFSNAQGGVIDFGIERLKFMYIFYSIVCIQSVATGMLRGMGYPIFTTVTSIICNFGVRILWMNTIFKLSPTYKTALASFPVAWSMVFIILSVYTVYVFKKEMRKEGNHKCPQ